MLISLKDAIRWLDSGDGIVLQVVRIESHMDWATGQGTRIEIWEDVPIVIALKESPTRDETNAKD